MIGTVLQMCPRGGDMAAYLKNFEFIRAFVCQYADPLGLAVVGLIVWGGVGLSLYIRTGSVLIPFVLLLALGGAIMSQIASVGVGIATIVVIGAGGGVVIALYNRMTA